MKLGHLVDIVVNNEECVVLKVKEGKEIDLIATGCFNGDETMLRLTKGANHTATVFRGKESFSWNWGVSGYTMVSDQISKRGNLIQNCMEEEFGIYMGTNKEKIKQTLHITTLDDKKNKKHHLKILYWPKKEQDPCNIHLNDEHFKWFNNVPEARSYVAEHYAIESAHNEVASTGCVVENYVVVSK